ncbi:MAG: hypothetical protein OEY33_08105 [Bdellovibrionales bacterium]|nr:hypothetical protein [Bdellovibrionales bacterium]
MKLKQIIKSKNTLPCFYCGADSDEMRFFLLAFIGGLVLFTIFSAIGLWLRGAFKNTEQLNDLPLRVENKE